MLEKNVNGRTYRNYFFALFVLLTCTQPLFGQQTSSDFDFWQSGVWTSELTIFNGDTILEKDQFVVEKLENKAAFLEDWTIYIGEGEFVPAKVMRAFDKESNQWKLFYVDDRYAQTWESEKIDDKIYFFKTFTFKGKKFYSRQYWSHQDEGLITRVIERSTDKENWTTRYYQIFRKIK